MANTPRRKQRRERDAGERQRVKPVATGSPRTRPLAKANAAGGNRAVIIRGEAKARGRWMALLGNERVIA
jgi:hypothetical protein